MSVDISGAIDLHCHFGPDAHRERSVTALEAATQARDAGHDGVLLKSHTEPTAQLARIVADAVAGISVYGGVSCDHEIGGLNPAAVETALRLGGRAHAARPGRRRDASAKAGGSSPDAPASRPCGSVMRTSRSHASNSGSGGRPRVSRAKTASWWESDW